MRIFYEKQIYLEESKEIRGKLGMKVAQLETSIEQSRRFIDHIEKYGN